MPFTKKFAKRPERVSIRQKRTQAIKKFSVPRSIATGYGFVSRQASTGFPDAVRTTLRYHDAGWTLNADAGTTAVHVFRLNRLVFSPLGQASLGPGSRRKRLRIHVVFGRCSTLFFQYLRSRRHWICIGSPANG